MKKIILVLVFVFASSSLVNADNLIEAKKDCFVEACETVAAFETWMELSEEQVDQIYDLAFRGCSGTLEE
ncbi:MULTISPECIES: hypothetical protein [Tenacibaculum]|uniref:hypothetical protein n=1 Tax=Tenacibaculum TaxID=104267 RepID=UPI001F0B4B26|nr:MULTISPECIES: hypothetical protein [Tenacibaculum]MCH3881570.1 hypothetical protein [Tenacibaculum aquimarinum]MDO6598835.1 hypothetical protein [Tenacibaculum sp. 1_MG-2023]